MGVHQVKPAIVHAERAHLRAQELAREKEQARAAQGPKGRRETPSASDRWPLQALEVTSLCTALALESSVHEWLLQVERRVQICARVCTRVGVGVCM